MSSKLSQFFAELKRRKVYHVAVVYIVVGWGVSQGAEYLFGGLLDLSPVISQAVAGLVILGFPIAVVLAWAYEVKPDDPERSQAAITPTTVPASGQKKSIVVLPFDNLSPDPVDTYFCEGLTEEIIANLSHIKSLRVISRNSAVAAKTSGKTVRELAAALSVEFILEGSVRKAGDKLRITAKLIQASSDENIWAGKHDGVLDDVFGMQEAVSKSVAKALNLVLSPAQENRIAEPPTDNAREYDCYLKARYELHRPTEAALKRAIRLLQQGLALFPRSAILFAALGETYYLQFDAGYISDPGILDRAEECARQSLSIDASLAQGQKVLGLLERGRGSLTAACRHMVAAYRADPIDPGIQLYTAAVLWEYAGQRSVAEPILKQLLEVDPFSGLNWLFAGILYTNGGDPAAALKMLARSAELMPEMPHTNFWIAHALAASGRLSEAEDVLAGAIDSGIPGPIGGLAVFLRHVLAKDDKNAVTALDAETRAYAWADPDFSFLMPGYFALLGRKEEALEWLRHAIDRDFINYPYLAECGPFLENLRNDRTFKETLMKVKTKWDEFRLTNESMVDVPQKRISSS